MVNLILLVSSFARYLVGFKALAAFILLSVVCLLFKFGLRRFKYKDGDLKAAGLNHRQCREWRAIERRKLKRGSGGSSGAGKKNTRHF